MTHLVVSGNKGTQYRPQNTIVLIIGTPKKVPIILGNPHLGITVPWTLNINHNIAIACVSSKPCLHSDRPLQKGLAIPALCNFLVLSCFEELNLSHQNMGGNRYILGFFITLKLLLPGVISNAICNSLISVLKLLLIGGSALD